MNQRINAPKVRLVGVDGSQLGIFFTRDAQKIADDQNLDLVEVAPSADPPVARVMDYGKYKYEQAIKAKLARKHQTTVQIKEIKFRPKIDRHDFDTKKKHVIRFLEAGAKVKITIMFRGREMAHPEMGLKILDRLALELGDMITVENEPKQEGRNVFMLIAPSRALEKRLKEEADAAAGITAEGVEGVEGVEDASVVEVTAIVESGEKDDATADETPAEDEKE